MGSVERILLEKGWVMLARYKVEEAGWRGGKRTMPGSKAGSACLCGQERGRQEGNKSRGLSH